MDDKKKPINAQEAIKKLEDLSRELINKQHNNESDKPNPISKLSLIELWQREINYWKKDIKRNLKPA